MSNYDYYKLEMKLSNWMLGTCTKSSIWMEHIISKSRKMIKEANRMTERVKKTHLKYKGDEIPEDKVLEELQAIARKFQEMTGDVTDLPDDVDKLFELCEDLEKKYDDLVKKGEEIKATVFMRNKEKHAVISTHMIIGNIKENLSIITNNTTLSKEKKIAKSKVSIQEMVTLDIKPVERFIVPSEDVVKGKDGKPALFERPIRFEDNFGKTATAIAASEYLPEGTEFTMHLRVRKDSPLNKKETLDFIFDLGKNNGLGQNRRAGYGQYFYKIKKIDHDPTPIPKGWK